MTTKQNSFYLQGGLPAGTDLDTTFHLTGPIQLGFPAGAATAPSITVASCSYTMSCRICLEYEMEADHPSHNTKVALDSTISDWCFVPDKLAHSDGSDSFKSQASSVLAISPYIPAAHHLPHKGETPQPPAPLVKSGSPAPPCDDREEAAVCNTEVQGEVTQLGAVTTKLTQQQFWDWLIAHDLDEEHDALVAQHGFDSAWELHLQDLLSAFDMRQPAQSKLAMLSMLATVQMRQNDRSALSMTITTTAAQIEDILRQLRDPVPPFARPFPARAALIRSLKERAPHVDVEFPPESMCWTDEEVELVWFSMGQLMDFVKSVARKRCRKRNASV